MNCRLRDTKTTTNTTLCTCDSWCSLRPPVHFGWIQGIVPEEIVRRILERLHRYAMGYIGKPEMHNVPEDERNATRLCKASVEQGATGDAINSKVGNINKTSHV